ncbi:cytoplasmic protein [Cryptococcus neoformans Tu401-1]|nr:cytoplasmic protein [Cryptococcus neoformans var. grubii Tu401-1]
MAKGKTTKQKTVPKAPPTITPPDPAHAIAHVPTHTADEKREQQASNKRSVTTPAEVEEDVCFICAEPITFWSVGVCGHKTCHVCAVRLRTFYKKTDCTFCKTPLPTVLFSRSPDTPFPSENHLEPSPPNAIAKAQEEAKKGERWDKGLTLPGTLDLGAFPYVDEKLGVVFEDEDMMESILTLLRFNCPYPDCSFQAVNWPSLERHTLSTHGKVICTLCRSQLSRFAHEQVLYTPHLLPLHDPSRLKRGQRPPKPRGPKEEEEVKSWEAPHPMCEFCHKAFFGPDELFKHMRSDHEECHVCREQGNRHVYFENYHKLEQHWRDEHYPCTQPQCIEDRFVVFGSELDLRAHMMEAHGNQMSARDRANARHLPVDFNTPSSGARGSNHSGGGRGFSLGQSSVPGAGRDSSAPSRMRANDSPHVQALDDTPAMTPAQIAQQKRQIQADRAESAAAGLNMSRRRGFATGLSREGEAAPSLAPMSAPASGYNTPREDVDEATASRHAELLSRVSMLTNDSATKLASFRSAVRSFKSNESGARDMVDSIFNIFERDLDVTVGIAREVAKLFGSEGDKDKEKDLIEALNTLRVEQRDQFPSLGSAPSGLGTNWSGVASGTILNAKRATRTSGTSRAVWDRVEAAAASQPVNKPRATTGVGGRWVPGAGGSRAQLSSESAFPTLGAVSSSMGPSRAVGSSSSTSSGPYATPWAAGGAGPSSRTPSALAGPQIRSVHNPAAATAKKSKALSSASFPALPASSGSRSMTAEERKALFSKPTPREESIRRITGQANAPPPLNSWAAGSSNERGEGDAMEGLSLEDQTGVRGQGQQQGAGKKKGKQKQLLFSVSARP